MVAGKGLFNLLQFMGKTHLKISAFCNCKQKKSTYLESKIFLITSIYSSSHCFILKQFVTKFDGSVFSCVQRDKEKKTKKQRCDTDTPFRVNSKLIGEHLATNQISQPSYQLVRRDQMKANAFVPGRIMYSQRSRFKIQFFPLRSLNRFSKPFGARSPSPQFTLGLCHHLHLHQRTPHSDRSVAFFFFFFDWRFCKRMQTVIV